MLALVMFALLLTVIALVVVVVLAVAELLGQPEDERPSRWHLDLGLGLTRGFLSAAPAASERYMLSAS
jgi:hypothetical protein